MRWESSRCLGITSGEDFYLYQNNQKKKVISPLIPSTHHNIFPASQLCGSSGSEIFKIFFWSWVFLFNTSVSLFGFSSQNSENRAIWSGVTNLSRLIKTPELSHLCYFWPPCRIGLCWRKWPCLCHQLWVDSGCILFSIF